MISACLRGWCALVVVAGLAAVAQGQTANGGGVVERSEEEVTKLQGEIRLNTTALRLLAESVKSPERDAAEATVKTAEGKVEEAIKTAGLVELRDRFSTAQKARDEKVDALLTNAPEFQAAKKRAAELEAAVDQARASWREAGAKPTAEEVLKVAALRQEADELAKRIARSQRALWLRGEVEGAYKTADGLYQEYNKKASAVAAAEKDLGEAKKKLQEVVDNPATAGPAGEAFVTKLAALKTALAGAEDKLATARKEWLGDKPWTTEVEIPGKKVKGGAPAKAHLWISPKVKTVRGLVMGHPPILGTIVPNNPRVRVAAAEEGLAVLNFDDLDALFDYSTKSPELLEAVIADLAQKSGHQELTRAPFLTFGHSTSGIWCRNVAYWQPTRTIGVVHIKSGNMHQHRPDPARTIAGVPFLAINGEFEEFGPEGGIQKAYGSQTQWVMIREQLLRWRAADQNYLLSLVVDPGQGHTTWNDELTRLVVMFIHKAAQTRLPRETPADGVVRCVPVKPESGWLMDADLDHPTCAPAAYGDYKGDKAKAFWTFDREMAEAVTGFEKGKMILPDPTKQTPVPASWPGGK